MFRPAIPLDDAAISFRYAERLATGRGFTYNDHERVLGASNPLYVLVLAAPIRLGLSVDHAAATVGTASYVACMALVVLLGARFGGVAGGIAAGAILGLDPFFRYQALSGMEVGLAAALGLGAIAAAASGRLAMAGVVAGLAVWNKLDGAAVVAAVGLADAVHRRRVPFRFLAAAGATCLPWLAWASWYFGSPLPQSLTVKLAGGERLPFDRLWFLRFLFHSSRLSAVLAAPLAFVMPGASDLAARVALTALGGWAALHVLAYSVVDLGAPYPWYLAVPIAPIAALAGIGVGNVVKTLTGSPRRPPLVAAAIVVAAVAVALAVPSIPWQRPDVQGWDALESDRRLAGIFLRRHASPGEVLDSPFGWPAFESRLPTNDTFGLNSVQRREPAAYRIEEHAAVGDPRSAPVADDMVALATFDLAHGRFPRYVSFRLVGRRDSAIARSGMRVSEADVDELGDARLVAAWRAHLGR